MVALHKEKSILHTANLGDSGFVVIRKNAIVHRSQEQQHYFNSPFQLAIHPTIKDSRLIADSPDMASVTSFDVEENDLIVIATDGVWDNLPDSTILDETKNLIVNSSNRSKENPNVNFIFAAVFLFQEPTSENLQRIAHALAKRALDNGNNPKFNSPFAKSAKRALGIDIIGKCSTKEKETIEFFFFRWKTRRYNSSFGCCHILLMKIKDKFVQTWC